jgi:hypothetical protein
MAITDSKPADTDYASMDGPALHEACGDNAANWAAAFNQHAIKLGYSKMDEGWLVGWFANAIERAHDVRTGAGASVLPDGSAFFIA